jgi:cell division protein FtsA
MGIERGQITNFEKLVGQIKKIKELVEHDLKQSLNQIMLAVPPIDTFVEPALAKTNLDVNQPITEEDVRRLFRQIAEQPYMDTYLPVNMIPRLFRIDENHLVQNPRGLSGISLMLEAIRVFAPITIISNLVHAVETAKFKIADITTGSISEALSALNSPEMFIRTCHINIGHSLTTITIINDGKVRHAHSLLIGGRDITRAIAEEFGITTEIANQLKMDFGRANDATKAVSTEKVIYIDDDKETKFITRGMLNAIITNQCDRIFKIIKSYVIDTMRIREQEYHYSLSGGTAELPNIMHILRQNFSSVETSLYRPSMLGIRNTKYSQLVGTAIFAHELALLVGSKNYNIEFDNPTPQEIPIVKEKAEPKVSNPTLRDCIASPELSEKNHPQTEHEFPRVEAEIPLLRDQLAELTNESNTKQMKIFGEDDTFLLGSDNTEDYFDKKLENSGVLVRFFDRIFNENEEDEK